MLKLIVLVVLCFFLQSVLTLSEEMEELGRQLHNECQEQTGVPEELIKTILDKKGFPDDNKLKCYLKCLMAEMAVIDDDGVIDVEAAIAVIPEEMKDNVEPTMRKCGAKIGSDPCDSAYLTHKCYYESNPEHYFIV